MPRIPLAIMISREEVDEPPPGSGLNVKAKLSSQRVQIFYVDLPCHKGYSFFDIHFRHRYTHDCRSGVFPCCSLPSKHEKSTFQFQNKNPHLVPPFCRKRLPYMPCLVRVVTGMSSSPSPLTNRTFHRRVGGSYDLADVEPHTHSTLTSSIESLGEPTLRLNRPYNSRMNNSATTVNPQAPRSYSYHSQRPSLHRNTTPFHHNSQQVQKQPSRSSLHLQAIQQQHSNTVSPRSSQVSAYVRHIASTSSVPPRPDLSCRPPQFGFRNLEGRPVYRSVQNNNDVILIK